MASLDICKRDERTLSADLCVRLSFNEKFCPIIVWHIIFEDSVNYAFFVKVSFNKDA